MKVEVEITEQMELAHGFCGENSDCDGCACLIGTDDCIFNYEIKTDKKEMENCKIRVVENIGDWSVELFGNPGTEFDVSNGCFNDLENFKWTKDNELFKNIDETNKYFGESDHFQTVFELVEVSI